MAMFIYGTKVFTKFKGYFGGQEVCPVCGNIYKRGYVKNSVWAHLDYIPLFPIKTNYFKMCPVCGRGIELKSKEAKAEMAAGADASRQEFECYAKHIIANKPKGILSTDNSFEFWVKDAVSGEEFCIASEITKDTVKNMKKARGLKKLPIIDA